MTLEDFLAPLKWTDEQVLRQYTKLASWWEGKGRSRYSLAHGFNVMSIISYLGHMPLQELPPPNDLLSWSYIYISSGTFCVIAGVDRARNLFESEFEHLTKITTGQLTELSPTLSFCQKIANCSRLPAFTAGLALMGKGGYELMDYLSNNNSSSFPEAMSDLTFGFSLFNYASSVYIKDYDPKLLDKKPFWKTAADYLKEKLSPQPTPVPASNKKTLENYLRGITT